MSTRPLRPAEDSPLARFAAVMAEARAAAAEVDPRDVAVALGELERVRVELWSKLSSPPTEDVLLTATEAAARLGIPVSAIYRRRWLFRVEVSPGRVRYSSAGLDRYIRSRTRTGR